MVAAVLIACLSVHDAPLEQLPVPSVPPETDQAYEVGLFVHEGVSVSVLPFT